jgi:hypothetical protein
MRISTSWVEASKIRPMKYLPNIRLTVNFFRWRRG